MRRINKTSLSVLFTAVFLLVSFLVSCSDDDSNPVDNTGNEQPTLTMTYPIVDTGQDACYDNNTTTSDPQAGTALYGQDAVYIVFGRALGYMNSMFVDVHGAGAQRTDPKIGEPSYGHGPQGDVRRVYNHVRCVRNKV